MSSLVPASSSANATAEQLFNMKKLALENAVTSARAAGRTHATLDDYLSSFTQLAQTGPVRIQDNMIPRIAADLRGQNLDGFLIRDPRLGRQNTRANADFMDLDGDRAVSDFYTNINFHQASLRHSIVDPAASFNTQLADAAEISNTTFNDHGGEASFRLGHGTYQNIRLTNFRGGDVRLEGSRVDGLDLRGEVLANGAISPNLITRISIGRGDNGRGQAASINNLNADGARVVEIQATAGAVISNASFRGTTVSAAGNTRGITLENVDFSGANLNNVNLSNARLSGVTLTADPRANRNMDLSGAILRDVKLDNGAPITGPEQLRALGIRFDPRRPPTITYREENVITQGAPPPERDPMAQLLSGVTLPARGGFAVAAADQTTISRGDAPMATGNAPVRSAAPAAIDMAYFARMSATNGKPNA